MLSRNDHVASEVHVARERIIDGAFPRRIQSHPMGLADIFHCPVKEH